MDKETELAKVVIQWLKEQNWEVWQEAKLVGKYYGPIHDIIAVKHDITWCIECKLSFNLKVIEQAYNSNAILKSIAVPKYNGFGEMLCRKLGIGIIYVKDYNIDEKSGKIFRENYNLYKEIIKTLENIPQSFVESGSKGGYWTPYKQTMISVKKYIEEHEGCSFKDIIDNLKNHHYASNATAKVCIRKDLEKYENKWCEINDGKYYIKRLVISK